MGSTRREIGGKLVGDDGDGSWRMDRYKKLEGSRDEYVVVIRK